ncbi:hypothetical protein [Sporolactobacillus laevolacticus]|uniref:Uncharacterized protein n=1 Tax=Sporolactobacillus laevolacticus DSM 442 TaxID=1395513 RepID=V6IY28_9BACL|nr:hypothetical protein [Sporolactobacillus laevolacticus]EST12250.1 hypothetical protein P343_08535 [Sporolactobacillus laevolacticus DSM 442]
MFISYLQFGLCYGIIGLIMGSMLGLLPFWRTWQTKHVAAFFLLLVAWLPIAVLTLIAAPLANRFRLSQDSDY